ncbi:MAG: hypothetical protein WCI40_07560 [Verrucomicrobiota bacterium]
MSIASELLELLRCPQTGQRLAVAAPQLLAELEAQRRAGTLLVEAAQPQWNPAEPLETVLVREDGRIGYPVQGGIPILLPDHGFKVAARF